MGKNDDQLLRERIIHKAKELFFRHGIRMVTMDQIATDLGMSKKTVYEMFKDKEAIIIQLMEFELKRQEDEMNAIRKSSINAVEEIMKTMQFFTIAYSKVTPIFFFELQKYHAAIWQHFLKFKDQCVCTMIEENLRIGIKQELYRKDLKVKILARMRMQQIDMAYDTRIFPIESFNPFDVQICMLEHFLYGICTLKGHKLINKYKHINEGDE
ncbi:MAG: hypothetical protein RIQ89_1135 [Bacteroidota bacterium]|jgi:AcrR family transcriptional regulator